MDISCIYHSALCFLFLEKTCLLVLQVSFCYLKFFSLTVLLNNVRPALPYSWKHPAALEQHLLLSPTSSLYLTLGSIQQPLSNIFSCHRLHHSTLLLTTSSSPWATSSLVTDFITLPYSWQPPAALEQHLLLSPTLSLYLTLGNLQQPLSNIFSCHRLHHFILLLAASSSPWATSSLVTDFITLPYSWQPPATLEQHLLLSPTSSLYLTFGNLQQLLSNIISFHNSPL